MGFVGQAKAAWPSWLTRANSKSPSNINKLMRSGFCLQILKKLFYYWKILHVMQQFNIIKLLADIIKHVKWLDDWWCSYIILKYFFLSFKTEFVYVVQTGLVLTIQFRLALPLWQSTDLSFLSAGITGVHYHAGSGLILKKTSLSTEVGGYKTRQGISAEPRDLAAEPHLERTEIFVLICKICPERNKAWYFQHSLISRTLKLLSVASGRSTSKKKAEIRGGMNYICRLLTKIKFSMSCLSFHLVFRQRLSFREAVGTQAMAGLQNLKMYSRCYFSNVF